MPRIAALTVDRRRRDTPSSKYRRSSRFLLSAFCDASVLMNDSPVICFVSKVGDSAKAVFWPSSPPVLPPQHPIDQIRTCPSCLPSSTPSPYVASRLLLSLPPAGTRAGQTGERKWRFTLFPSFLPSSSFACRVLAAWTISPFCPSIPCSRTPTSFPSSRSEVSRRAPVARQVEPKTSFCDQDGCLQP